MQSLCFSGWGFRAFLYAVGDLYVDRELGFLRWHAVAPGCVIGL